jgi:Icc-related predicted phosphoesterase
MRPFPGCLFLSHDYHGCGPWWLWTIENSHLFHLLALSGDHVEATETLTLPQQTEMVRKTVKLISNSSAWIALSGGNHDRDVGQAKWLRAVEGKNYVGMGQNKIITLRNGAKVVVTSCPDNCTASEDTEKEIRSLFQQGATSEGDFWLVLHHEPPDRGLTCAQAPGSKLLRSLLKQYHPDLVSTGHKHGAPWSKKGGAWMETIDETVVVNAGQKPFRSRPCHVTLVGAKLEHHVW